MFNSKNAIWIQNENFNLPEYMFYGNERLKASDTHKTAILRELFFKKFSIRKSIWKDKGYSQSEVSSLNQGFILTGELENVDELNRKLPFMFYLEGETQVMKSYIQAKLFEIDKKIDNNVFDFMLNEINVYRKPKSFLFNLIEIIKIILNKLFKLWKK